MDNKGNPENLSLPKPAHAGFVTKNIERTAANLQRYFGVEPFTKRIPELSNKRYHGQPEDFQFHIAFSKAGDMVFVPESFF